MAAAYNTFGENNQTYRKILAGKTESARQSTYAHKRA